MFERRIRKWIPVILVILFVAGAVALVMLLPEKPSTPQPVQLTPAPDPTLTPESTAPSNPDEIAPNDMPDDSTDSDLIPRLPTLDEDDQKGYPAPFGPPDEST